MLVALAAAFLCDGCSDDCEEAQGVLDECDFGPSVERAALDCDGGDADDAAECILELEYP